MPAILNHKPFRECEADWNKEFPCLSRYSHNKLYEIAGPLLTGFEFDKNSILEPSYRLYYSIEPLWRPGVERYALVIDAIEYIIRRRRYKQLFKSTIRHRVDVHCWQHDFYFSQHAEGTHKYWDSLISKRISLTELIKYILSMRRFYYRPTESDYMCSYELVLGLATYYDNKTLVNIMWKKIDQYIIRCKRYRQKQDDDFYQEKWIERLHATFDDRDKFMELIKCNIRKPKVVWLPKGTIIDDFSPKDERWLRAKNRSLFCKKTEYL